MRIGFVSTRLAGTDGVSLETWKWVNVLEAWGHECFYFAGEVEAPPERAMVVPEAHFRHPRIRRVQRALFETLERTAPGEYHFVLPLSGLEGETSVSGDFEDFDHSDDSNA